MPDRYLVLMGVSGAGKTTIAKALQSRLGWDFQEGDDLHPPANVEKMRAGHALDDADRAPWLRAVAGWIDAQRQAGRPGLITCSALKRAYRDVLRHDDVRFVYLQASRDWLLERVSHRHHQYMPASLLDSQLATLEAPGPDENAWTVSVQVSIDATVEAIESRLRQTQL